MTADRAARPALARVVRVDRLRAGVLRHRGDDAGEILPVERAERALTVRQDGDLDRRAPPLVGGRRRRGDCGRRAPRRAASGISFRLAS